ncbi:MAG TPA: hypothetical protein PL003_09065, partial [Bacteroidales bacterium]|nr:hypothetical protein [Bacteroidales bacterium]
MDTMKLSSHHNNNPGKVDFKLTILTDGNPFRVEEVEEVEGGLLPLPMADWGYWKASPQGWKTFCLSYPRNRLNRQYDSDM